MARYKLKLKRLDFISVVDQPAQEPATTLLIKRAGDRDTIKAVARLAKIDEALGLAFFWAFKSTDENGDPYHDLQGDQVISDDEMVKAAMEFMENGGAVDEQHDGAPGAGRVVFAMPMTSEIASAYGVTTKQSGLMVAIKPKPDVMAKLKSGEYTGVSMAGTGVREKVASVKPTAKATWSTADIDSLPDSSFLYVEPGGKKDADGKTTPRSLRHFPYRDAAGKIDIDHLRDATGRIPQSSLPKALRDKLQVKAEKLLAAQHSKSIRKEAVLTSEGDGHQHAIDLDDPGEPWLDMYSTSYQTAEGADQGHCHTWTFDPSTGAITVGADSGHTHTVDTAVPSDVLAVWTARDAADDAANMAEANAPIVIADDPSDGVPMAMPVEESSGAVISVTIAAQAPQRISTPKQAARNAGLVAKEPSTMPDPKDTKIAELEKSLADAKRLATLTDAQRAHVGKLSGDAAEAFLAKSHPDRDSVLADIEKANEVVYTSKTTGETYRKSDDPRLVAMAKRDDIRETELSKAKADRESEILKARAKAEIGHMTGDDDTKIALLKAIDGAGDAKDKVIAMLKGADAMCKILGAATGVAGHDNETASPLAKFNSELAEFAKAANKTPAAATAEFVNTPRGAELYTDAETVRLSRINGQA